MLSGPVDCDVLVVSNNSAGLVFCDSDSVDLPFSLPSNFSKKFSIKIKNDKMI